MIIEFHNHRWNLPKIPQYEDIPYAPGLCCPDCSSNVLLYRWSEEMESDEVVGYIENQHGELEIVKQCKHCHQKYRFHMAKRYNSDFSFDVEYWKHHVGLHLFLYHCGILLEV